LGPLAWVILPPVKGRHREIRGTIERALAAAAALALAMAFALPSFAAANNAATVSKPRTAAAPVPVPIPRPQNAANSTAETPPPAGQQPGAAPAPAADSGPPIAAIKAGALPVTLPFAAGSTNLNDPIRDRLDALADSLVGNDKRVQLLAFAKAEGADAAYVARRLSLERALAVRGYLIGKGIRSTRIDVRALGANGTGPIDRVEVVGAGR
jgi:outer membrane protein OmpA-like peptidoglycan-associated protein